MVQFSSFSTLDKKFRDWFVSGLWLGTDPRKLRYSAESPNFLRLVPSQLTREMPKISFLKSISWFFCLKLLSSFPKPLNLSFYIKTQLNSIVFLSINISKVIFNSFHWFWSLDYVFGGFVIIVGIFSNGGWKS